MLGAPPGTLLDCGDGTGNWPPTRNDAVSPDTAVRLGSASVFTRPFDSSAWSSAVSEAAAPSGVTALKAANGVEVKFCALGLRVKRVPPRLKLPVGAMPISLT